MQLIYRLKRCVGPSEEGNIDVEDLIDILHSRRRRRVINHMSQANEPVSVQDVSRVLSDREGSDRQTVYISLYQNHIPKLDRYDVIDYDDEAAELSRGENMAVVADVLSCIESRV